MKSLIKSLVLSLVISCFVWAVQAQAGKSRQEIVQSATRQVASIDPEAASDDLDFLRDFIGGATVVVLGESQHLAREQYLLKHRITRFLVENMDFRHIAIEDSIFGTIPVDDYIKGAQISPEAVLEKTGAWYLWDTEEMLSLIKWLRSFNDQVPEKGKVSYTGIDIEDPWPGILFMRDYFKLVDSELSSHLELHQDLLQVFNQPIWFMVKNRYSELSPDEADQIASILDQAGQHLVNYQDIYIKRGGIEKFTDCVEVVNNLEKAHDYFIELQTIGDGEVGIREKTMFENIARIVDTSGLGEKVVVWVHNAHAAKSPIAFFKNGDRDTGEMELLGSMLKNRYGERIKSVGMTSLGPGDPEINKDDKEKILDHFIFDLGRDLSFLDLSVPVLGDMNENPLNSMWKLTADQGGYLFLNPSQAFDGIFFMKQITAARYSAGSATKIKEIF